MAFTLDYERLVFLDAESLAEVGMREAYDSLLPELCKYLSRDALPIEEMTDHHVGRYSVRCGTREFAISGPELSENSHYNSWGRASFAFFTIINDQLAASDYRFYAINGGNDLGGMFLTPAQAQAAQKTLPHPRDWPYLPANEPPWFGQFH
jgi:hypothetical protein